MNTEFPSICAKRGDRPTAEQTLAWLEFHAERVWIQSIPAGHRSKNRTILQYRDKSGEVQTVGARSICGAVERATLRDKAFEGRNVSTGKGEE